MIPLRDQEIIRRRFNDHLGGSVRIDHFTQPNVDLVAPGREPCPTCEDARTVIREIGALSDKVRLEEHHLGSAGEVAAKLGIDAVPATVIRGPNNRPLRFLGIPGGAQFPGFIETIIAASHGGFDEARNGVSLDYATKQRLRKLRDDVRMTVLVTPTCGFSPQMALLAFALGLETHHVHVEVIEVEEFPRLQQRYRIEATPTTVLNDDVVVVGGMNEADMLEHLILAARGQGKLGKTTRTEYATRLQMPQAQPRPGAPGGPPAERRTRGGLILP